jgi:D-glycero-D-manno-heptose 1,7-bisphosphate phosphatase
MQRALFLDRDGVINVDVNYAHTPEQIIFIDGIFDVARAARARDYKIIIVTNQAGIGRGLYTEAQFHALMQWMCSCFAQEGAPVTAYYFCPHHPEHGQGAYKVACECRKPKPGMLLAAIREHNIDAGNSVMVGDKESDVQAGLAAGLSTCLLATEEKDIINIIKTMRW